MLSRRGFIRSIHADEDPGKARRVTIELFDLSEPTVKKHFVVFETRERQLLLPGTRVDVQLVEVVEPPEEVPF